MQNAENNNSETVNDKLIQMSKDYTDFLMTGNESQAEIVFTDMCRLNQYQQTAQDHYLYGEVGKFTRELHDSINQFVSDSRIQVVADEEMPDARQRLNHIVELTEKSAHKTMSLIEHSIPLLSSLDERLIQFKGHFDDVSMDKKITNMLEYASSVSKKVSNDLNEIMLAQDYQDLTGQIIQRVSALVQNVETNLIGLLKIAEIGGGSMDLSQKTDGIDEKENNSNGFGPVVPGVKHGEVLQSQDDVDDLLSSLGF